MIQGSCLNNDKLSQDVFPKCIYLSWDINDTTVFLKIHILLYCFILDYYIVYLDLTDVSKLFSTTSTELDYVQNPFI